MSLTAIDWGPSPYAYTLIAGCWALVMIVLGSIARRWRQTSEAGKVLATGVGLIAVAVFAAATNYFYIIFRFASWPAFRWRTFAVFGLPALALGVYVAATNRSRNVSPN